MFGRKKSDVPATEAEVLEALKKVVVPDLNGNIVDLDFVKKLRICGGNVAFDVALPTANLAKEQLKKTCEDNVGAIAGVENVAVNILAPSPQKPPQAQPPKSPSGLRAPELKNLIPTVKHAIAVASGKGGVGKSTTAVNLAIALAQSGARVGLMDADIYGPSIPIMLGVPENEQPEVVVDLTGHQRIVPIERFGIKLISVGFLTDKGNPIVWRGPMVSKMIQQFLGSVEWGELDYLVIDLPPGTGDTQLSLVQSAPLAGAVIVTTPEAVASEDVLRAGRMFEKMADGGTPVPILGIVENMSWFETPQGERINLFGEGGGQRAAGAFNVPLLGQIPREIEITRGGDAGQPIVAAHPESSVARTYREIAASVTRRVDALAMQRGVFRVPPANAPGVIPLMK